MDTLSENAVLEGSLQKILWALKRHSAAAAPFVMLFALLVFFSIASPRFASLDNLRNILSEISVTGIIAVGLTFVVLCAEIDLSVASVANATGVIAAFFTAQAGTVSIDNIPLPARRRSRCRSPPVSSWASLTPSGSSKSAFHPS